MTMTRTFKCFNIESARTSIWANVIAWRRLAPAIGEVFAAEHAKFGSKAIAMSFRRRPAAISTRSSGPTSDSAAPQCSMAASKSGLRKDARLSAGRQGAIRRQFHGRAATRVSLSAKTPSLRRGTIQAWSSSTRLAPNPTRVLNRALRSAGSHSGKRQCTGGDIV
jgi:hypothetical protein